MPITAGALPSQVPFQAVPFDANWALSTQPGPQNLTATGYMGAPAQLDVGVGRIEGYWAIDITAIDFSSNDETYKAHLFGSNDVAWGNGNVELLAFHDFAAVTAGRQVATILGPTPSIPPVGAAGTLLVIPWTNLMQRITF